MIEEERRWELVRELLKTTGISKEAIFRPGGLMKELTNTVVEEVLAGEMEHHFGYKERTPRWRARTRASPSRADAP